MTAYRRANPPVPDDDDIHYASHADDQAMAAFLDGRLTAREAAALERHLAGCSECFREFLELKLVLGKRAEVPPAFLERAGAPRRLVHLPLRAVLGAAATLLVAAVLVLLFTLDRPLMSPPPSPDAALVRTVPGSVPAKAPPSSPPRPAPRSADKKGSDERTRDPVAVRREAKEALAETPAGQLESESPAGGGRPGGADAEVRVEKAKLEQASPPPAPAEAVPVRTQAAEAQKRLQGEPRFPQTGGPSPAVNQNVGFNLNAVQVDGRGSEAVVDRLAVWTGDLGPADLLNPQALARLPRLQTETGVEIEVDASGRIRRVDFLSPLSSRLRRSIQTVLQELAFQPAAAPRKARLVLRRHWPD